MQFNLTFIIVLYFFVYKHIMLTLQKKSQPLTDLHLININPNSKKSFHFIRFTKDLVMPIVV